MLFSTEFRLNKDVVYHKRSIYTFLDLLGDLGGLSDALISIMSCIVTLYFNFIGEPIKEYLLNALFLKSTTRDFESKRKANLSNGEKLKSLKQRGPFELPKVLC